MRFQNILCPVDFLEASEAAARYAGRIAEQSGGRLTYLHVIPEPGFEYAAAEAGPNSLHQLSIRRAAGARRALDEFVDGPVDPEDVVRRLEAGDAASEILRVARENGHDLIVMPTRGRSVIRRWLTVGSVTTKVLHGAECPVISSVDFLSAGARFPGRDVICAIDLGQYAKRVLCTAVGIAREFGARLTVVHAVPSPGEALEDFMDDTWRTTLRSRVTSRITEMLQSMEAGASIVVETGDAYAAVPRVAEKVGAGLIVIGRSSSNGVLGRLRAHAYEIVRRSPCPVLSV